MMEELKRFLNERAVIVGERRDVLVWLETDDGYQYSEGEPLTKEELEEFGCLMGEMLNVHLYCHVDC